MTEYYDTYDSSSPAFCNCLQASTYHLDSRVKESTIYGPQGSLAVSLEETPNMESQVRDGAVQYRGAGNMPESTVVIA